MTGEISHPRQLLWSEEEKQRNISSFTGLCGDDSRLTGSNRPSTTMSTSDMILAYLPRYFANGLYQGLRRWSSPSACTKLSMICSPPSGWTRVQHRSFLVALHDSLRSLQSRSTAVGCIGALTVRSWPPQRFLFEIVARWALIVFSATSVNPVWIRWEK